MLKRMIRVLIALLFVLLGLSLNYLLFQIVDISYLATITHLPLKILWTGIIFSIIFGILGFALAPFFIRFFVASIKWLEVRLMKMPLPDLLSGAIGMTLGLLVANLFNQSFRNIVILGPFLAVVVSIFCGYVGLIIGIKRREDLLGFLSFRRRERGEKPEKPEKIKRSNSVSGDKSYKILDTSVIIDGRIADIVQTGFIDGILLVPEFVLNELQRIADSSDVLKRNRGRRGLDTLSQIFKKEDIPIEISPRDFEDLTEVDSKLVRLAQTLNGPILTNDYNLNKIAELHGVKVLNINELANVVKPVVLPGEEMLVQILREGKEAGQGVAYLDDGTMVVVDGGRRLIGQEITAIVTTVLQTAAGRMIFVKPKDHANGEEFTHEAEVFG